MTIQRQYSLPNCTLILEGLSRDAAATGQKDGRPLISILVNAECHFADSEKLLTGGRDFFESLVRSVSAYAQEFLSGIRHPQAHESGSDAVHLERVDEKHLHRLIWHPAAENNSTETAPVQIDLTTVQLFDLVEAVDQFLADSCTLPDLSLQLQPVSRRYRKAGEPVVKRAAPAALGMTSLALAAVAFFFVPIPEVREPEPVRSQSKSSETSSNTTESSATGTSTTSSTPISEDSESLSASTLEITDPTELSFLQQNLREKLDEAWENRGQVIESLEYRVSVAKDGKIVGYKPVEETPLNADEQTPLPDLLYLPSNDNTTARQALGQFRVVFTNGGVLQVSPWKGFTAEPTFGPEITDSTLLRQLNDQLYTQIREAWKVTPSYPEDLVYRVAVTEEGVIANYQLNNQPALDYIEETPLPRIVKPQTGGIDTSESLVPEKPLGQFKVVFTPSGYLEVSPWRGYQ